MTAVGHPEWIADDKAAYVCIASELASDPARLKILRTELRDDMKRSPLLDHAGQAARFGDALRACWIEWREKSVPQPVCQNGAQKSPATTSPSSLSGVRPPGC